MAEDPRDKNAASDESDYEKTLSKLASQAEERQPGICELLRVYGQYEEVVSYGQQYLSPPLLTADLPVTNSTKAKK